MKFIHGLLYFTPLFTFGLVVYALWRNQRAAKDSELVDDSNFGPRVGAIIEVVLHPDRAATWEQPDGKLVFPKLGKDSSEINEIRPDDGK